jgi:hypothetical protein
MRWHTGREVAYYMITRPDQRICSQVVCLDRPWSREDVFRRQRLARPRGVQPGKIVSKCIRASDCAVRQRSRILEDILGFGFGEFAQLINGDGRAARFGDVVFTVILMLVHPLIGVSPCRSCKPDRVLAASTEKESILTISEGRVG